MASLFRATFMLSVLVGLPAAWVYYGPLPPSAQRVVNQCVAAAKEAVDWDKIDWSRMPKFDLPWSTKPAASSPLAPLATTTPRRDQAPAATLTAPTSMMAPATTSLTAVQPTAAPSTPTAPAQGATPLHDALEPLLGQLRTWNAVEYSLERWGAGGSLFRFRCEMPLAEAGGVTQEFQATADSPRAAVEQVVREVAAWQAARQSFEAPSRLASN